jgi:hypothetical protein
MNSMWPPMFVSHDLLLDPFKHKKEQHKLHINFNISINTIQQIPYHFLKATAKKHYTSSN